MGEIIQSEPFFIKEGAKNLQVQQGNPKTAWRATRSHQATHTILGYFWVPEEEPPVESEGGVHRLLGSADSSHVGDTTIVEKEGEVVDKEKWANDEVGAEHVCECEVVLGTKIVFRDPVVESLPYYEVEVGGEVVGEGLGQCEVQIRGEAVGEGLRLCEVQVGGEVVGEGLTF
ncbi:hypothetical protein DEO72_LG7g1745 [Vigna unguiculata]|uniref:Uncharacterized protein n=1 Tax=Vigna unguiculata TaxID=3917 RepID=A0A4D6ML11_VIGUN|nr:hypothetical protein DEO72_LG7g1745 [Vigna unguiculata]